MNSKANKDISGIFGRKEMENLRGKERKSEREKINYIENLLTNGLQLQRKQRNPHKRKMSFFVSY